MPNGQQRLARLAALADTHAIEPEGRIDALLKQSTDDPDAINCPRYAALSEYLGAHSLFCEDSLAELVDTLTETALSEIPETPVAIIDLDTDERYRAGSSIVISFTPPLPGLCEHVARIGGEERGALRRLCDITQRHAAEDPGAAEAITITERIMRAPQGPAS